MHHRISGNPVIALLLLWALPPALHAADAAPWAAPALSVESGFLWKVKHNSPINYQLVPTQFSWRSAEFMSHEFANGSRLVVRHRLTLLVTWVKHGPESHYFGVAGSPSAEWWNKAGSGSLFIGVGGGFGWIDSRGVTGGQGQDFTLNWFARAGFERVFCGRFHAIAGVMFQHLSNGGMTKPNPGIDALGLTLGTSWPF